MLRFHRFHADVRPPTPAREAYVKHQGGRGWPEECPPLRAANAFGFDVELTWPIAFVRKRDGFWTLEGEREITSDWCWEPPGGGGGDPVPLRQKNAWFWDRGQEIPHRITDDVFPALKNQVKISTFLYLETDPNELLVITDVPNLPRPYRGMTAIVDTDWYPASYPWHCVLELDPHEKRIELPAGTPVCRLYTVRRDHYFAKEMTTAEFEGFFERGQAWLARHGKGPPSEMMDITHGYVKNQAKARFQVLD